MEIILQYLYFLFYIQKKFIHGINEYKSAKEKISFMGFISALFVLFIMLVLVICLHEIIHNGYIYIALVLIGFYLFLMNYFASLYQKNWEIFEERYIKSQGVKRK